MLKGEKGELSVREMRGERQKIRKNKNREPKNLLSVVRTFRIKMSVHKKRTFNFLFQKWEGGSVSKAAATQAREAKLGSRACVRAAVAYL